MKLTNCPCHGWKTAKTYEQRDETYESKINYQKFQHQVGFLERKRHSDYKTESRERKKVENE